MRTRARWLATLLAGILFAVAGPAAARPEPGWWWNPAESGRGFFIESLDDLIYMAGYLYQSDGHALWVVAGGPNNDPYNYTGRLLTYSGGQTLTGTYHAPSAPQDIGQVSIHFSDDTHATLTWPGGTVQLQREIFGTGTPGFKPSTGWWWNPAESGRGYSIEVQSNALFFVGFMYEADGRPVWLFSAGPVGDDPSTYSGPLLQFSNGQTMGGPYQAPGNPATVGHLDVAFTADNQGTLTFTGSALADTPSPRADSTATVPIQIEFDKPGTYVPPPGFEGVWNVDTVVHAEQSGAITDTKVSMQLQLVWVVNEELTLPGTATYDLDRGTVAISVSGTEVVPAAQSSCDISGGAVLPFKSSLDNSSLPGFSLLATSHAHYQFQLTLDKGQASYDQFTKCTVAGQSLPATKVTLPIVVNFYRSGPIKGDIISGLGTSTQSSGAAYTTSLYNWTFPAIR